MSALPKPIPSRLVLRLPDRLRLLLAKFALWRRRQRAHLKASMTALCLAVLSAVFGYVLADPSVRLALGSPTTIALDLSDASSGVAAEPPVVKSTAALDGYSTNAWHARQLGELQAEVLRLRLLFRRVAAAADLDGDEFALAVQLADQRFEDSLSTLDNAAEQTSQRFSLVKRAVDHMTDQGELMLSISERRHQARKFTLSGSPVTRAHITSLYGLRQDPRSGLQRVHRGMDFGGRAGDKIFALADGVVTYAGNNGGYGNLVELEHAGGYRTRYAHNDNNLVNVGGLVKAGQAIATMGSTGKSTGTHLHLEVLEQGHAIDPRQFVYSEKAELRQ